MDQLKITISGISEVLVEDLTIKPNIEWVVISNFKYDKDNNFIGKIGCKIVNGKNYDLFIEISGLGEECFCGVYNETKHRDYGTESDSLSIDGGVNFNFNLY